MSTKPLRGKSYGSIPHLPGSRLGPGDHHVTEGQARICCERARDRHDLIIVQEKLDGSNVAAANIGGQIVALTRAGWTADSSPYEQHHMWAAWVRENEHRFRAVLNDGERLCGEWLAQAHGTRYELKHEPFVVFDKFNEPGGPRLAYLDFLDEIEAGEFITANTIHMGAPLSIERAMEKLTIWGSGHGALDVVEGAVWRVERGGVVDFLAKFVIPSKIDGRYLPEVSGKDAVWNWRMWSEKRKT